MMFFDITPAGALMNAMDASAAKDREIARLEIERGVERPEPRARVAGSVSGAVRAVAGVVEQFHGMGALWRAPQQHTKA